MAWIRAGMRRVNTSQIVLVREYTRSQEGACLRACEVMLRVEGGRPYGFDLAGQEAEQFLAAIDRQPRRSSLVARLVMKIKRLEQEAEEERRQLFACLDLQRLAFEGWRSAWEELRRRDEEIAELRKPTHHNGERGNRCHAQP